jgi:RNA polymerase sigma-70 factor (ECF subfamily)
VAQECCLKLSELLPDPERGATAGPTFRAWLQRIAVNEFRDARRAGNALMRGGGRRIGPLPEGPNGEELLEGDASTPSRQAMRQEDVERLKAALARLPADHQEVVRLRCSEQLNWAQIAQQMSRPEGAVKKLFERVRKRLGKELRGQP